MNTLEQMIAKAEQEKDVRKRMTSLRDDADMLLDDMAKAHAAEHGSAYLDSYGAICKSEMGHRILSTREEASRFIESQPSQE